MKPLSLPQSPDRPRVLSARTDLGYRRQMHPNALEIDRRVERQQPPLVELDPCDEQIDLRARNDYADVDEFLALDLGHDADDCIVIREMIVHAAPPRERRAAPRADPPDIERKRLGRAAARRPNRRLTTARATSPRLSR